MSRDRGVIVITKVTSQNEQLNRERLLRSARNDSFNKQPESRLCDRKQPVPYFSGKQTHKMNNCTKQYLFNKQQ